jgi:hypothetical protein
MKNKKQKKVKLAPDAAAYVALIEETPTKVLSLLAAVLFSTAFLFSVTVTEASFSGTTYRVSDPFASEKVVAALDHASASYSSFISQNFIEPISVDYAVYADNAKWLFQESGLAYALGVDGLMDGSVTAQGQVAGAQISAPENYAKGAFSVDTLYAAILGN